MPEAPPQPAPPPTKPDTEPAPPDRRTQPDPFDPDWPDGRPLPQPKALCVVSDR